MTTALINGAASKSSSSKSSSYNSFMNLISQMTMEQVVGISAVAGTSVFVVKVVRYAARSPKNTDDDDDESTGSVSMTKAASLSLLGLIRRILRKLLLDDPQVSSRRTKSIDNHDLSSPGDGKVITHNGSCHCETIQFQVKAPRCLNAKEGPGKIQYRHTTIHAVNYRLIAGHECLKTYMIYRNNAKKGCHCFCERCGVHILYAPSRQTPTLNINVNCLLGNGISKVKVVSKKDTISAGFAADGQWDTSDQLSTISEVTQPFHFQLSHMHSDSTGGDWTKNYVRHNSSDLFSVGEHDDEDVPVKKVSVPPQTPTTMSSSVEMESMYASQIAELQQMAPNQQRGPSGSNISLADDLTNDDMSFSDEASLSSARQRRITMNHATPIRRHLSRPPRYSMPSAAPAASSPEARNKMRYFMGKYNKHEQQQIDDSADSSAQTATTAASSMGELN
ncbi:MAG: hypothetical protein SGILL_008677 [Bacillariaceae sp.]